MVKWSQVSFLLSTITGLHSLDEVNYRISAFKTIYSLSLMTVRLIYHTRAETLSDYTEVYFYTRALLGAICTVSEVYVC